MTETVLGALYRGDRAGAEALASLRGDDLDVFEAAALGRAGRVRELLAADPGLASAWTDDGFTALHLAAFFGTPEAVSVLLGAGADPAAQGRGTIRVMPLHSAAAMSQTESARLLLDAGASVDAVQDGGFTALHSAAANGNEELVQLLLERGADPEARTDDGRTPSDLRD